MVTIHYLGGKIEQHKCSMEDAMFHLGAKFGAVRYNYGIKKGLIKIRKEANRYIIHPDIFKIEKINGETI